MSVGVQLGRPGVYLVPQRPPEGLQPVRLDVAGFVGVAARGPVNVPVRVSSWTDFERRFGGYDLPAPAGAGSRPLLPYAVEAFFAQGGEHAWVVRVTAPPGAAGPTGEQATALYGLDVKGPEPTLPYGRWQLLAADEGVWGDRLRIELDFATSRTITVEQILAADLLLLPRGAGPPDGSLCRIRRADLPPAGVIRSLGQVPDPARPGRVFRLSAALPPAPVGVATRLEIVTATLTVVDTTPGLPRSERLAGLGLCPEHPRFLPAVLTTESLLLRAGSGWDPLVPGPLLTPIRATLRRAGADRSVGIEAGSFFDDGEPHADPTDEGEPHRGVDALAAEVPELGILAVPDLTWGPAGDTGLDARNPEELAEIVRRQQRTVAAADLARRFVVLLDVPRGLSPDGITDWRAGFTSSYAGAYHPWLGAPARIGAGLADAVRRGLVAQPPIGELVMVPPSSYAAGIMASRERRLGLSRGPSNELASGAVRAADPPSEALADRLHLLGINLFLAERDGFRLTAGRTLSTDPDYRQLSVRRLMTMLALVVERQTQWLVFEPNTAALRGRLTHSLTQLLRDLHRRGAFAGDSEADSFFVRCDNAANPPESIAQGRLIAEVGVAPAAPLEYLVLRITADVAAGVTITEG